MPIRKLAAAAAYTPEQLTSMIHAYESACAALGIARTEHALAEAVALKILECAGTGEFDPRGPGATIRCTRFAATMAAAHRTTISPALREARRPQS